jgi:hypothetical protein
MTHDDPRLQAEAKALAIKVRTLENRVRRDAVDEATELILAFAQRCQEEAEKELTREHVERCDAEYRLQKAEARADALAAELDAAWKAIERGYEIEAREYFEREAPHNGFKYPLAQAIHHIWKRDPQVASLAARLAEVEGERGRDEGRHRL